MQATINADLVKKLAPKEKPFDVIPGLVLEVDGNGTCFSLA